MESIATMLRERIAVRPRAAFVLAAAVVLGLPGEATGETVTAIPVGDFLGSIGVCTTFPDRGQPLDKTIEMIRYAGIRWVRGGTEGLKEDGPSTIKTYLELHEKTGVKFSWSPGSGGSNLRKLIDSAKVLARADALLAFEGNNEPNNWGITYDGEKGGGKAASWMAVAKLQRDLYAAVKSDPVLKTYPVWGPSEVGAQKDNVGLQYLTIPAGANTLMAEGTKYADYLNCHNYIYHPNSSKVGDNKTWNASDPTSACKVDGLYGNHGKTWLKKFDGYTEAELIKIPKVTTETGTTIGKEVTEEIHGLNVMSMYLDQFKRGWSYTAFYILRDRTDEGGNQSFGFFDREYKPRKAALYLHNLTMILDDKGMVWKVGKLEYSIPERPATVHDMLLQRSDGLFVLVVWGEWVKGEDAVTVKLAEKQHVVKIYDPTLGTQVKEELKDVDAIKLKVSDHPLVLIMGEK